MKRLSILVLIIPFTLALPPLRAEEPAKPPLVVLRAKSLDGLAADIRYLAKSLDKEEEAKQFDNFYKTTIVGQGIDVKHPWGLYGRASEEILNSSAVVMLPISDTKEFLKLLEKFDVKNEKDDDDIYSLTVAQIPVPILLRFKDKYGYFTFRDKKFLEDKELLDADKLLAGDCGILSLDLHIDQIPEKVAKQFMEQVEEKVKQDEEEQKERAGVSEEELKGARFGRDAVLKAFKEILHNGSTLSVRIDIDQKSEKLSSDISLKGKSGTSLAKSIEQLGQAKSRFAALAGPDLAFGLFGHFGLPEGFGKLIYEAAEHGLHEKAKKDDEENEDEKKAVAEQILKAIKPTFEQEEIDAVMMYRGKADDEHFTLLAGMKIKDGAALEKALRDSIKTMPDEAKKQLKLDASKVGDTAVHLVKIDEGEMKKNPIYPVTGTREFYFAIGPDAILMTIGPDALAAMKEALEAKPAAAPVALIDIPCARLAAIANLMKDTAQAKHMHKAAKDVFKGPLAGKDRFRFTIEGGKSLSARITVDIAVIKFCERIGEKAHESEDE